MAATVPELEPLPVEATDISVRVGADAGTRVTWERPAFVVQDEARHQILARSSLRLEPGEFVAVIGESGSGKTTLLRTLAGIIRPNTGQVTVRGEPVDTMRSRIGYVPQENIVHDRLTVREALRYAARLRLPVDTGRREVEETVRRVIAELELENRASVQIGRLSGGQRKRVVVGTELLNRPGLLILDEPTTGLDPTLEARLMRLFRELADHGRTLVMATHATKSLRLCDQVAVVGRGGNLSFAGPPAEALRFFGVDSFDGIYQALLDRPAHHWRREFEERRQELGAGAETNGRPVDGAAASGVVTRPPRERPSRARAPEFRPGDGRAGTSGPSRARPARRIARHTATLSARYARLFLRDRRNLFLLLVQAPIMAAAIVIVFDPSVFTRIAIGFDPSLVGPQERLDPSLVTRGASNPFRAAQLLYALVITAIFLGSINAAREIVKERTVVEREATVGVGAGSYLASKLVIQLTLVVTQIALVCAVVFFFRPLDEPNSALLAIFATLVVLALVAVAMGLFISAASRTQEQATGVIPLTLIPQLLFCGAIVPIATLSPPVAALSKLAYGQPAFAGLGAAIDLDGRIAEDPTLRLLDEYGPNFFDVGAVHVGLWLGGFLALFLLLAFLRLPRRG